MNHLDDIKLSSGKFRQYIIGLAVLERNLKNTIKVSTQDEFPNHMTFYEYL